MEFRNEGVSWIIRILWNFGENIQEKELPDFLDSKAKQFLLEVILYNIGLLIKFNLKSIFYNIFVESKK